MPARPVSPHRSGTLRRILAVLLLAATTALATATPALAHTSLQRSTPAKGAALSTPPAQVSLTFGEAVSLPDNPIKIAGADGTAWTVGPAAVTDATVTAPVIAAGPAGAYTLTWSVISDDGDTINGTIPFTLTTAATTTASTPTSAPPTSTAAPAPSAAQTPEPVGSGVPAWVWIVLAVVVVVAAGVVVRGRSRRSGRG